MIATAWNNGQHHAGGAGCGPGCLRREEGDGKGGLMQGREDARETEG